MERCDVLSIFILNPTPVAGLYTALPVVVVLIEHH
jgi:hypothetical protein